MIPKKLAKILYWQAEKFRGRIGVKERLNWLLETQMLSSKELKSIQLSKLNYILNHAFSTVPYYKHIFNEHSIHPDDINTECDLKKIPILTREILLKHQDELISSKADFNTLKNNNSSGSTGRRAVFKQDLDFRLWMRAHQIRTYKWCNNWDLGEKFVLLWGSEIYWNMHSILDKIVNLISNRREFNTFRLSSRLIRNFTEKLHKFDPVLISSYSNALHLISLEAKKQNLNLPSLRAIQTTSEPMPPAMRKRIEKTFNCEVFDKYGSRETNIVYHESPNHDGMLVQCENVCVEFLRESGQYCDYGESGKLILTTLNNFSMPLIRYETSDIAAPLEGYSSNSYKFQRMSSVSGREQDLICTNKGDYIDSYFFSYLLMRFQNIHWFQVIQNQYDSLLIRILAPNGLEQKFRVEINERIKHHTNFDFKISYEILDEMPISTTGKFRLCVSNVEESQNVSNAILNLSNLK